MSTRTYRGAPLGLESRGPFAPLAGLAAAGALALLALLALPGCNTEAYCFADCQTVSSATASGSGGSGGDLTVGTGGEGGTLFASSSGEGGCTMQTNGGIEICDDIDNDCNGLVDDSPDIDFNSIKTCGTCENNCLQIAVGCKLDHITCTPSADPGNVPGACGCTQPDGCTDGHKDLDNNPVDCEYVCPVFPPAADDSSCNKKDDDCDGLIDEDVDLCTSKTDCGSCGHNCSLPHATAKCVNDGNMPCDGSNTQCVIDKCDCNGPGDCWYDIDPVSLGCEYQCDKTNNGIEICGDGLDNDCDGKIDDADDLSQDPQIGKPCFGDPDGLCATPAHQGTTQCVGNQVVCGGNAVLHQDDVMETCNGVDDDCDGTVDDSPMDAGGSCGTSNIFPCQLGTEQCQNGALVCVGKIDPKPELCNGTDDDCNGTIDDNTTDSGASCGVSNNAPCKLGMTKCQGGALVCSGNVDPQSPNDTCGVDANCDGQLTNQPNLQTDPKNCGACGNDCLAGSVHAQWGCVNGACQFQGCDPGYYDNSVPKDNKCEYACVFVSAQEACNGNDDNCNGQIDENVPAPSKTQVCGISPSATAPECTSGVTVACSNGSFKCTFPNGVCNGGNPPSCANTPEICDALDNNCNGAINENVGNYGKPCASDDAAPGTQGVCKTTGTFVCNGPNATVCSAVKANCANLPGGCTELCDGLDNDCDGVADETFQAKGANASFFVKPAITKIAASLWVYQFESSRPNATTVTPGSGNGYWCNTSPCPGGTPVAPGGQTLDKTKACSVPSKIPWFNVTPIEGEQTCNAMGGRLCTLTDWQTACKGPTNVCTWGYAPNGAATCASSFVAGTKYCNLGPSYDFDAATPGDQDGLLVTQSAALKNCYADWTTVFGNTAVTGQIADITGNLREMAKDTSVNPAVYRLMGGAFNSGSEAGAQCGFTFYTGDQNFQLFDLGYRCCFTVDPTL